MSRPPLARRPILPVGSKTQQRLAVWLWPRPPVDWSADSMRAWQVIGPSSIESRFEALRSEATPLVGRDEELELLIRRWRQATTGRGRVVLLSGEPGIGKSRLTAALSQAIGGEPHTRLR